MGNPPASEQRKQPGPPGVPGEAEMQELRELLVGPEKSGLQQLQQRLDDPKLHAREIALVLPEALSLRAGESNDLVPALQGTVERILKKSVEKNPEPIIEALFPIIGPAIRRAITGALRGMMKSFETALNHSISPQSMKWRMEAWRSGKPFAEVVLLHTLRYRVEQVFLIHRESGLVLQHVRDENAPAEDPALVSGMLTALQDFARDSFRASGDDELESLDFGELTVLLEQGPDAVLAGVVRGTPPAELRFEFQRVLEEIHRRQGEALNEFDGDDSVFSLARPHLESCLHAELLEGSERSKRPSRFWWAALTLILLGVALWAFFTIRESRRWSAYLADLKQKPGIVVTEAERSGDRIVLAGLKDPLSADAAQSLQASSLEGYRLEQRWELYHSLHPEMIGRRVRETLGPPPSVQIEVGEQSVRLAGEAPFDWLARARELAPVIPGVAKLDLSGLQGTLPAEVVRIVEDVQGTRLLFDSGSGRIRPGQEAAISELQNRFSELEQWARQYGVIFEIEIRGHTDPTGAESFNQRLARQRAEAVRLRLLPTDGGESPLRFTAGSALIGVASPAGSPEDQRSVSFVVTESTN